MIVHEVTKPCGTIDAFVLGDGFWMESVTIIDLARACLDQARQLVRDEIHLQFMRARPDLLWIHAGVVERDGEAMLLAGPTGQGKSTLSTRLLEMGWKFMSDDLAPLRMSSDEVLPFPQKPARRIHPGREIESTRVWEIEREVVPVSECKTRSAPALVSKVVFVKYVPESEPSISSLRPATGAFDLLQSAFNMDDHRIAAVEKVTALARRVPMFRISSSNGKSAVELLRNLD